MSINQVCAGCSWTRLDLVMDFKKIWHLASHGGWSCFISKRALELTCCLVHRRSGSCWGCRTLTAHWRTSLCAWKRPRLKEINKTRVAESVGEDKAASSSKTNLWILTVAGEPLRLVDARRQFGEDKHVHVGDHLAHILLLQIWLLLLIIVIDSPWEDSSKLMKQKREEKSCKVEEY